MLAKRTRCSIGLSPVIRTPARHERSWRILARGERRGRWIPQALLMLPHHGAGGEIVGAQGGENRDQAIVASDLEIANRNASRLIVRLRGDEIDQFVGEFGRLPVWSTAVSEPGPNCARKWRMPASPPAIR